MGGMQAGSRGRGAANTRRGSGAVHVGPIPSAPSPSWGTRGFPPCHSSLSLSPPSRVSVQARLKPRWSRSKAQRRNLHVIRTHLPMSFFQKPPNRPSPLEGGASPVPPPDVCCCCGDDDDDGDDED